MAPSSPTENDTLRVSMREVSSSHLPMRWAWPWLEQAKAVTSILDSRNGGD